MARYPIKMLLDKDLGPFIPYLPSNAVVVEGSNKTVADQITDLHNEIDERLATVYDFKGSVTFENLPITGQKTGDVYDITNDFILNDQKYPAGTNLAWATDHWDPLAGLLNVKTVYKKLDLSVAMMATVSSISGYAFTIEANKAEWLKLINDTVKAGEQYVDFVTTKDDGYTFRLFILNTTDGTQNCNMMIYTPLYKLYNLHYADTYWYSKTVKITFADGVATDITVQTGSGYSYREWLYPQFRNTTAFTPTADTHLATKKYVDDGLSLKEALINKVTSLLNTSTDTEYPSAKAVFDFVNNNKIYKMPTHGYGVPIILDTLEVGTYIEMETWYYYSYKKTASDTHEYSVGGTSSDPIALFVFKKLNDVEIPSSGTSEPFASTLVVITGPANYTEGDLRLYTFALDSNANVVVTLQHSFGQLSTSRAQTFAGTKTFGSLPRSVSTAYSVTANEHLTNKSYVDLQNYSQSIGKIESSFPLSVINNTGDLMYNVDHDSDIMTVITDLVKKVYFNLKFTTGPIYFYNVYERGVYYRLEMDLNKDDIANHNKIFIKPVYTADLLQRLNTGKAYWTEAVFTTSGATSYSFNKFVYDATAGISGEIFNVLVTNNMEPYTPTLDYAPANKKYVDDAIKGTDLSQYVELSQADPDIILRNVRYANIGDSFSLTYIVGTTADKAGIAFYVKIPVSHYYKTTPSAYTYEPMGTVTYFEYDSQTQIATPKNAYGYLTYNPSDPDHVEIKIYPLDYNSQVGILANSYFYVNCNWIRI